MKIAIAVPSWPPGSVPNGIVTYASQLVPALRQLGHEVFVVTGRKLADDDPYTIDLKHYSPQPSILNRARYKFASETGRRNLSSSKITSAIGDLVAKHQIEVFEIEESFGTNFAVSRLNIVPVVVRLHGPWFLTGKYERQQNWSHDKSPS